jgi:hypothetical protein
MMSRNPGRLAIHRRSDEIVFLQDRLHALGEIQRVKTVNPLPVHSVQRELQSEALERQRELADELLHTRQIEPLGEALQRRLAMAERVCQSLIPTDPSHTISEPAAGSDTYRLAEVERLALVDMLQRWWTWLRET